MRQHMRRRRQRSDRETRPMTSWLWYFPTGALHVASSVVIVVIVIVIILLASSKSSSSSSSSSRCCHDDGGSGGDGGRGWTMNEAPEAASVNVPAPAPTPASASAIVIVITALIYMTVVVHRSRLFMFFRSSFFFSLHF
jgi:hypothetical protein